MAAVAAILDVGKKEPRKLCQLIFSWAIYTDTIHDFETN